MGTNYYVWYNICKCCHRHNDIHIGKSSYGWTFTFHAPSEYVDMSLLDPKVALTDSHEYNLNISSFKEWKEFLEKYVRDYETAEIHDEYGTLVSLDEFYELVEQKRGGKKHAAEMKTDSRYRNIYDEKRDFLDSEGNSFSRGEFC